MIDNFDLIKENILFFDTEEEFYLIQIIQRKNKGPFDKTRVLKTYYIYNEKQYFSYKDEIINICNLYNARAYIYINRRNAKELCLYAIEAYSELLRNKQFNGEKVWLKVCGKHKASKKTHLWIVDLDTKNLNTLEECSKIINSVEGPDYNRVKSIVPTVNGFHLITCGFNTDQFQKLFGKDNNITIHKDNPTLLFA